MTDLRKAAEMALEALESFKCAQNPIVPQSIHVLRQALAQPDKPLRLSPVYEYGHIHEASQPEQDKLLVDLIQEQRAEIDRLRQALAQPEQRAAWQGNGGAGYNVGGTGVAKPEQEPVRWFQQFGDAPPKREWVGLTDEEISELYYLSGYGSKEYDGGANNFARAIEAKLKEKNT